MKKDDYFTTLHLYALMQPHQQTTEKRGCIRLFFQSVAFAGCKDSGCALSKKLFKKESERVCIVGFLTTFAL